MVQSRPTSGRGSRSRPTTGSTRGRSAAPTTSTSATSTTTTSIPAWLSEHCSKDATVILPDYPVDDLRHELHELGFRRFVETADCEPFDLDDGLRIMVMALDAPTDGPLGDSALLVDDGEIRAS